MLLDQSDPVDAVMVGRGEIPAAGRRAGRSWVTPVPTQQEHYYLPRELRRVAGLV